MIIDIFCHRPQYHFREPICLVAEKEQSDDEKEVPAHVTVWHFSHIVSDVSITFHFDSNSFLSSPAAIFNNGESGTGYSVYVQTKGNSFYTAFDIYQSERDMPRYGFMCRFRTDAEDEKAGLYLLKHHITWVQFYDWMYRHEQLLPDSETFTDIMGRSMNIKAVEQRISQCLSLGMNPIAYGAVYAASYPFAASRPDWMLYDGDGNPLDFIGRLRYMDISSGSPWRSHIENQFAQAVGVLHFSGIHLDTYGFPKNALNSSGKEVALENCFPGLIDETKEYIYTHTGQDPILVFNNVGNWPVDTVAVTNQDALYIEVWPPYERYKHLIDIVDKARILAHNKPLIISAYAKAFTDYSKEAAWKSAFLLQAVLAASGAHPLLLGENNGILTKAYYPDYYVEDDVYWLSLQRAYSDFLVQWGELLYPMSSRNVSYTHALGDNREYQFFGGEFSPDCCGGKIGFIIHEMQGYKTIHLLDLRNNNDMWQEGKSLIAEPKMITIKVLVLHKPESVYTASPEENHGSAAPVTWTMEHSSEGLFIRFDILVEHPWHMVVIEN